MNQTFNIVFFLVLGWVVLQVQSPFVQSLNDMTRQYFDDTQVTS